MITFKDIFKTSFLENIVSMQLGDILLSLILAVILDYLLHLYIKRLMKVYLLIMSLDDV